MNNERSGSEIQIDLADCFKAVLKNWYIVALAALAGIIISFLVNVVGYEQEYSASIKLYVNNRNTTSTGWTQSDITASRSLVKEYLVVLTSRPTLDKACEKVNNQYGYALNSKELKGMISGDAINDTTVFEVTITDTSPDRAINIANSIADSFPTEVEKIYESSSARVIEYAVDAKAISPGHVTKILLGAIIGIVLACAYAVIMGVFVNDTIESDEWIVSNYENQIPILGMIPDENFESANKYKYKNHYAPRYTSHKPAETSSSDNKEQGGNK